MATIVLFKKSGKDNSNPSNYRPISLLSSVSKIFEKIIHPKLTNNLNAINAIPHFQFGFKSNHSTIQQLLHLTEHINNGFEKKHYTGAAFLDGAQAFYRVRHDGLLYKLKTLNIPAAIYKLIKSYLSERCFKVRINETTSETKLIHAGVPQDSKCSPILFNLYVSDFPTTNNTEIALYSDDSDIYSSTKDVEPITQNIQAHLNEIQK
ncbi:Reverse transcriptase domain [Cinara cedri]|uniref:Reverse transcriptase domain n=1 Tax=Cinara cedri TaxID=506608 RepID=A0A5E4MT61_9HEMI|nr:Reverse transcriptase domain [Cinara cedri]